MGSSTRLERVVLHVTSPRPTPVRCVWLQEGSRIQHEGTTPFRLVLPATRVREVSLGTTAVGAGVTVDIRGPVLEARRFVMERDRLSLRLTRVEAGWRWDCL